MNRRTFFRRASIVASGAVAADQLELLDRLGWVRRLFPSAGLPSNSRAGNNITVNRGNWDALFKEAYVMEDIVSVVNLTTPFRKHMNDHRELRRLTNRDRVIDWMGNA